jgi:alpha-tubulin suppressor-like RCC1 family protein
VRTKRDLANSATPIAHSDGVRLNGNRTMKRILPLIPSTLRHKGKHKILTLCSVLGAWLGAGTVPAQSPVAVAAWGNDSDGQTSVPVSAQSGVNAIAAGYAHTLALKNDGSVVAWGYNFSGQTTVPLAAQTGVTAIAAGVEHTVALKVDGSVVAWGDDSHGQTTVPVTAQSEVTAIAAGFDHTVALKANGSVVAWGENRCGQATVPDTAQNGVTAIAAGGSHTVALKADGSVVAWGDDGSGQTTVPVAARSRVTAIAAGASHVLALKNDGTVVAWGANWAGQTMVPTGLSNVTAIAAGAYHSLALRNDGTVVAWGGWDDSGLTTLPVGLGKVTAIAAGANHTVVLVVPTPLAIIAQPVSRTVNEWQRTSFTLTAAGFPAYYQWRKDGVDVLGETSATYSLSLIPTNLAGSYTVVVSNPTGSVTSTPAVLTVNPAPAGSVVAWGGLQEVPLAAQSGVTAIAAGGGNFDSAGGLRIYIVALKNDGSVMAWGDNRNPQGRAPVPVAAESAVTAIAAGGYHTVALKDDGAVVAWGDNSAGQVTGTATTNTDSAIAIPVTLGGAVLSNVTAIAAGFYHTVALKDDGTVVAWGDNSAGQVTGTATTNTDSAIAIPVTLGVKVLSNVTAIAAGFYHTVALKKDGTVVAWGDNSLGQVTGTPTTNGDSAIAISVTLGGAVLSNVTAVAAGFSHTVALKKDGTVAAWGNNRAGQVTGTSTTNGDSAIAISVTLGGAVLSNVTAVAAGASHTLALKSDGTVVAWGWLYGTATVPAGLDNVTAIAAGAFHTVVLIGTVPLLPTLNAKSNGNELILSWLTNAAGFTLQSAPSLAPPVTWSDSTNPAVVIGKQFAITNTISGTSRFYRLRKPL